MLTRPVQTSPEEIFRIKITWLVQVRWATLVAQIAAVIAIVRWIGVHLPLGALMLLFLAELATNLGCLWWLRQPRPVREWHAVLVVALDIILFSTLLYLTGGPANPFSTLYLVHLALAGLVLQPRWTWALVGLALLSSALLFVWHLPLPILMPGHSLQQHIHGHAPGDYYRLHLQGMWLALALAATFIVYFLHRANEALAARDRQLLAAREQNARHERLASLATLAAGAAHELASPLSTIAVVAKELHRHLDRIDDSDGAADAALIREQVQRCRGILDQMAAEAGHSAGELPARLAIESLLDGVLEAIPGAQRVVVAVNENAQTHALSVPRQALSNALRSLVKNALDATPPTGTVCLEVSHASPIWQFTVVDSGAGMTTEVCERAVEPFFTTKEPGRGMGLGLFLAHTVAQRLGGSLTLQSEPGQGTIANLTILDAVGAPPNTGPASGQE